MTWVKIDDQFHAHPKVLHAWKACRASLGLHVMALSHAGAYLTDGEVSESWVNERTYLTPAERRKAVAALVGAGLWEPCEGGWGIHDYLTYNEPRAEVLERRRQAPSRARAGAAADARAGRGRVPSRPTPDLFPSAS